MHDLVLILDFGSQYSELIARRVRDLHVYSLIYPYNIDIEKIRELNPKGIILSGGPANVGVGESPDLDVKIFDLGVPILGICYGMQLLNHLKGGKVCESLKREYGSALLSVDNRSLLFHGLSSVEDVWMSHSDRVEEIADGFDIIAENESSPVAGFASRDNLVYGIQFHPEVSHTPNGIKVLENFLYRICNLSGDFTIRSFISDQIVKIRDLVKDSKVVLGLSGGVDSSVAGRLLHEAIGDQLTAIFVDNGLLRLNEADEVMDLYKDHFKMNIVKVDASRYFLSKLEGVTDPQAKRKIIGPAFVDIFSKEAEKIKGVKFLAQGTLYPDVIESMNVRGPSAVIKTHHNLALGDLKLELIEPLRELFKDEVRVLGEELGIPHEILWRHPFPGPGLAIRVIGDVSSERLDILRKADKILIDLLKKSDHYDKVWQSFAVLLSSVRSVGVMGDERTYENVLVIRSVDSKDAMTANWSRLPYDLLSMISNRIINEVKGINRVVYDITSKPPGTIEWE